MAEKVENVTFKDRALQALAIIGLVAILLIGAWGIIQIAFSLPTLLSGNSSPVVSPAQGENLGISIPSLLTSGQPFTLSWTHSGGTGNYSYAISYSCTNGFSLKAPLPAGGTQTVPCNTPFNFTNASQQVSLTPELPGYKQAPVTFTVVSNNLSTGAITSSASSTATVLPALSGSGRITTASPASTPPYSSAGSAASSHPTRTLSGLPDLSVQITSVTQPTPGQYSVRFVVQNVGTNKVPTGWTFTALLPTQTPYTYVSNPQRALYPGDKIVYTLGFTLPGGNVCGAYQYPYTGVPNLPCAYPSYSNNSTVVITIDPQNLIQESSKANNTASAMVPGLY